MANPDHVELARQGENAINRWCREHPGARFDLSGAELSYGSLIEGDLTEANLRGAQLDRSELTMVRLTNADLTTANLTQAYLIEVDLVGASLAEADLSLASLHASNLSGADLTSTTLVLTEIADCNLDGANLSHVILGYTAFNSVDLSRVRGLASVTHDGPSYIDVDTLIKSLRGAGNVLTADLQLFFQEAGVPINLLKELSRLVMDVQYYRCFISYGDPDRAFAEKLREELMKRGAPAWLYSMDATVGARTQGEIRQMRREAEKMVLVCSYKSLIRDGVLKEIEEQIDEEPDKIIVISLDDDWKHPGFRVQRTSSDLKPYLLDKNYANFAKADFGTPPFDDALARLLRGLARPE